jgi:hypothetical protein
LRVWPATERVNSEGTAPVTIFAAGKQMATILEFPATPMRGHSGTALSGGAAEVVIFPGIRYHRSEESPAPAKAKKRPAQRRDLLELDD